ncbi:MAG: hypothetical protein RJB11_388, partial [Planctomycetota bacterium]
RWVEGQGIHEVPLVGQPIDGRR